MDKKYTYLTATDRVKFEQLIDLRFSLTEISKRLKIPISTLSMEKKKGLVFYENQCFYSGRHAQLLTMANLSYRGAKSIIGKIPKKIIRKLEYLIAFKRYSPAAALAKVKMENPGEKICCLKTLYTYIGKGLLKNVTNDNLVYKAERRREYNKIVRLPRRAPSGSSIEQRPKEIDSREEFGHWEMDLVIGKKDKIDGAILSLTERKTRLQILVYLKSKCHSAVVLAMNHFESVLKDKFSSIFKTVTVDNGTEFCGCEDFERSALYFGSRTKLYYCHPSAPNERGTNENQHKLLRRFVPKGHSINDYIRQIRSIQLWMNRYPRKLFLWASAEERFVHELMKSKIKINRAIKQIFGIKDG